MANKLKNKVFETGNKQFTLEYRYLQWDKEDWDHKNDQPCDYNDAKDEYATIDIEIPQEHIHHAYNWMNYYDNGCSTEEFEEAEIYFTEITDKIEMPKYSCGQQPSTLKENKTRYKDNPVLCAREHLNDFAFSFGNNENNVFTCLHWSELVKSLFKWSMMKSKVDTLTLEQKTQITSDLKLYQRHFKEAA